MFGTILHDIFNYEERSEVQGALECLCSPLDAYGWASVGIYAWFDPIAVPSFPATNASTLAGSRIQYLGLARDLPERFSQHTGLIKVPPKGCKVREIERWFADHDLLGFSCLVQSPFAQVNTHRERNRIKRDVQDEELRGGMHDNPDEGLESAVMLEGQMIETFRLIHGSVPPWNKIGGSRLGASAAAHGSAAGLLQLMEGGHDSLFRAQRSTRQLSQEPSAAAFEMGPLHLARMEALLSAVSEGAGDRQIVQTINRLRREPLYVDAMYEHQVSEMIRQGYLSDVPAARELTSIDPPPE